MTNIFYLLTSSVREFCLPINNIHVRVVAKMRLPDVPHNWDIYGVAPKGNNTCTCVHNVGHCLILLQQVQA